jgi:hypothetical protein
MGVEFWRYYLNKYYSEYFDLGHHEDIIHNFENVFEPDGDFDLMIDLRRESCRTPDGNDYTMAEFIARLNDLSLKEAEHDIEMEYGRWEVKEDSRKQNLSYVRDTEKCCWKKKKDKDSYQVVTKFDLILTSIIEKYSLKLDLWERSYEVILRFRKFGKEFKKEVTLTPEDTHNAAAFSRAVWEVNELEVINLKNDEEMRSLWVHINDYYQPRIVREYEYYGFIEFEGEKMYLAENVLIRFPKEEGQKLQLIAMKEGSFPVSSNKYVKPPDDAIHLPWLDVGTAKNGQYKDKMNQLLSDSSFESLVDKVGSHFCQMIGGDSEFGQWGKLIMGYIFSYIFFDEIYDHFKHIIYLYFYGEGNVGKGELAKRILDFYGINYLDSLNTPPPRSVDEALEQKSQIPQWIDEHVPEVPGKEVKTEDQTWNSWFELKMRRTNMQKGGTWGAERKSVRTSPLFCSNFKPKTDHLLSRCIILEYRYDRRGEEKHNIWLKNNKELLQLLLLSYMQKYHLLDREVFDWDIERNRKRLKRDVNEELNRQNDQAILQDRQISQFATLFTVYHWFYGDYRREICALRAKEDKLSQLKHENYRKVQQEELTQRLESIDDRNLYDFIKGELVSTSLNAAKHDPLTDYIETIGTLIQIGEITEAQFNWTDEGHLKMWAKAVWDIYAKNKRGSDDMVRRQTVEDKLKEMSELTSNGTLKTVNWKYGVTLDGKKTTRQKGFYIKEAAQSELFANAFHIGKYGPNMDKLKTDTKPINVDDEPPF